MKTGFRDAESEEGFRSTLKEFFDQEKSESYEEKVAFLRDAQTVDPAPGTANFFDPPFPGHPVSPLCVKKPK